MRQTSSAPGAGRPRRTQAAQAMQNQNQGLKFQKAPPLIHRCLRLRTGNSESFDRTSTRLRPRSSGFRCAFQTLKGSGWHGLPGNGRWRLRLRLPHLYLNGPQRPRQRAPQPRSGNAYPSNLRHGLRHRQSRRVQAMLKQRRAGRTRVRQAVPLLGRLLLPEEAALAPLLCLLYLFPTSASGTGSGWWEATGWPASGWWR